jgi:hypothetical protein
VLDAAEHRGVISYATSRDGFDWTYRKIVLREDFHLSYPFVFDHDDTYYMVVESWQDNGIRLYRAENFPEEWRLEERLLEGVHVDNTLLRHDDRWWMFVGARFPFDKLFLYHSPELAAGWQPHPASPLRMHDRENSRPGGRVIAWDGKLIRYAQNCVPHYGYSVNAFVIDHLSPTGYSERAWSSNPVLEAGMEDWNALGMHHIDPHLTEQGSWIAMVDGRAPSRPDHRILVTFENGGMLLGYHLRPATVKAGDSVLLSFFWKHLPASQEGATYSSFVHFLDADGNIVFQADYTFEGENERYDRIQKIPDHLEGEFAIRVGMATTEALEPLPLETSLKEKTATTVRLPTKLKVLPPARRSAGG